MKVGFVQFAPVFGRKERNFYKVEKLLKDTKDALIVLPELFNTGYTFKTKKEAIKLAETASSVTLNFLAYLCKKNKLAIVAGIAEKLGQRLYNSSIFVTEKGLQSVYRKAHLFLNEKRWFTPGNTHFVPVDYKKVKIGMIVCFDWIYPEAMRTYALNGADIICHPANLVMPYCQAAMLTRSIENRVFIITANRTGREKRGRYSFNFTGLSQIVAPGGRLLCRATGQGETVRVVRIDPWLARNKKVNYLNDILKDRRPELYFR